jgi:hypothetical protein
MLEQRVANFFETLMIGKVDLKKLDAGESERHTMMV